MNHQSAQNGHVKNTSAEFTERTRDSGERGATDGAVTPSVERSKLLTAIGGEPLAGSGFEDEQPQEDFL